MRKHSVDWVALRVWLCSALEANNTSSTESVSPTKAREFLPGTASTGDGSGTPAFASLDSPRSSTLRNGRDSRGRSWWFSLASDDTQTPGHHPRTQELVVDVGSNRPSHGRRLYSSPGQFACRAQRSVPEQQVSSFEQTVSNPRCYFDCARRCTSGVAFDEAPKPLRRLYEKNSRNLRCPDSAYRTRPGAGRRRQSPPRRSQRSRPAGQSRLWARAVEGSLIVPGTTTVRQLLLALAGISSHQQPERNCEHGKAHAGCNVSQQHSIECPLRSDRVER